MIADRRKRKVGQTWRLNQEIIQDGVWISAGYYGIHKMHDDQKPPTAEIICYRNVYGDKIPSNSYRVISINRRAITTANNLWEFVDDSAPHFESKGHVVYCMTCGSNAEIVVGVSMPQYICKNCSSEGKSSFRYA